MSVRRALFASPLAVVVAICAHLVALGFDHAPGAQRASELLGALGAALALGIATAFASGLVRGARAEAAPHLARWYAPLFLAAAGAASFGCIEFAEGHFALRALLEAALVSLPLAYVVAYLACAARSVLRAAGASYGDSVCAASSRASRAIVRLAREVRACIAHSFVVRGILRGRAPPILI
jgi:hypothetical protein